MDNVNNLRVAICSDTHLEFGDLIVKNDKNADVLILSGDIMLADDLHSHPEPANTSDQAAIANGTGLGRAQLRAQSFRDFLKRVSFQFPHVIYVAGNHEYYHGNFPVSQDYLREECNKFPNVYFLENETKEIKGVKFIGATLWTDMNNHDPLTIYHVEHIMTDFSIIRMNQKDYRKFKPNDAIVEHVKSKTYIAETIKNDPTGTYVVVSHHAPSKASIKPKYERDHLMNGAYSSDLSDFILDHPQIKLWTHGHTHEPFDYMIGSTRVVCNPRGYHGYESRADKFELQYLDIQVNNSGI